MTVTAFEHVAGVLVRHTLYEYVPLPLPELEIIDPVKRLRGLQGLLDVRYEDLALTNYQSHGKIAAAVAV